MITRSSLFFRSLFLAAVALAGLTSARAQLELRGTSFNHLFQGALPNGGTNPPVVAGSQFSGKFANGGGSAALLTTRTGTNPVVVTVTPLTVPTNATQLATLTSGVLPTQLINLYPATTLVILRRSTVGGAFGSGVPRYQLGEVIQPPATQLDGITPAGAAYWRQAPVAAGESFFQTATSTTDVPVPAGKVASVTVTNGGSGYSPSSPPTVSFSGGGGSGAAASATVSSSGEITAITVTNSGSGYTTLPTVSLSATAGAGAIAVAAGPAPNYYYSPHADRVFATQAGSVSITWVTNIPVNTATGLKYASKPETFAVSSTAGKPTRTIYWTKNSFNGPPVKIPAGKIDTVNPVYNANFPATVAQEYAGVGLSQPDDNSAKPPSEKRTLWFEKTAGIGMIHAYNLEGRLFIEYLGAPRQGAGQVHEFLGADIVDVLRAAEPVPVQVELGEPLQPLAATTPAPDTIGQWLASPIRTTGTETVSFYGTNTRPDGNSIYYAERENLSPERVAFYWLERTDAAITLPGAVAPNLGIDWPRVRNHYTQVWPNSLDRFAHYTVGPNGSTPATGLQFPAGQLPNIVFQDDLTLTEAQFDGATQRLWVTPGADGLNRSLLKFSANSQVWYVRLYTQSETRPRSIAIEVTNSGSGYTTAPAVVIGGNITGAAAQANVVNGRVTSITVTNAGSSYRLGGTVTLSGGGGSGATAVISEASFWESDGVAPIVPDPTKVGVRIAAPAGYEAAGYIAGGTSYWPDAYRNPFAVGMDAAKQGAIIPVNAVPGDITLKVWWFKKVSPVPANAAFQPFYTPSKVRTYTVSYPTDANIDTIVMASNAGSGELTGAQIVGSLYVQNNRTAPGFNPNEEHALLIGGRAYALRDDLNNVTPSPTSYTSQPFVLLSYVDPLDARPAMRVWKVLRDDPPNGKVFNYPVTAGKTIPAPMPLPLLPLPLDASGVTKNKEVAGTNDPAPATPTNLTNFHATFTFTDRKGQKWVYRGPHAAGSPTLGMQFYYTMREGFFVPALSAQPAVGTILPYLRPLVDGSPQGDAVTGTPLTVIYRPEWPASAPELRVAETLTLPKFGLPAIYTQTSAQVLYQQSVAVSGATKPSVTLHDPTREKTFPLGAAGQLAAIPSEIVTTKYQGKDYFQGLPPHLQQRFFFDPARGTKGALVLLGKFEDVIAGEDYLNLNVLSAEDLKSIKNLPKTDPAGPDYPNTSWNDAIAGLTTRVETFVEDPKKAGAYTAQTEATPVESKPSSVDAVTLAEITHPDSAVDHYALTATGKGSGWVTMIFGNGEAFTPEGEPVTVEVFKVAPRLYTGDLKVNFSSNPLDEQVSLRHSGDFAAKPEDYEFEWRYAPPQNGEAPPVYDFTPVAKNLGRWKLVADPFGALPTSAEYSAVTAEFDLPRAVEIQRWLDRVTIVEGGTGYTSNPTVGFAGGGGSGATATATVDLATGKVAAVTVTNPGSNYTSAPQITFSGGGGAGAIATAVKRASGSNATAGIASITVANSGLGYTGAPAVALAGGGGSGATAVATINAATTRVTSIQITNAGSGYTSVPTVTLTGGGGQGATAVAVRGIAPDGFTGGSARPGLVARSTAGVDFTTGVPAKIIFSAALSDPNAGFVLYINGVAALAFQAPETFTNTGASTGLVSGGLGLARQFVVGESYFRTGANTLEVALYSSADAGVVSSIEFQLHATLENDRVVGASPWQQPSGTLSNQVVVGGDATAPLGNPLLVMSDNYFTMRYRPKINTGNILAVGSNQSAVPWSRWMEPGLVEGWIKRVLAGINPFNQRVGDLFNNAVNTDVSLLTQAGKRWEGNVALNLANINDSGLIEIYETVLNRGKNISIANGYDYGPANDALLLAAGYLNDLYTIFGHEAFADAANPTISVDDSATATEISTSRFAFEGQVKSVLEEELALLRGRDDFLSPSVATAPAYNRLYWNYTRGINAGEALYAVNYNIREKAGSTTADGKLDAADAQRMFPQAHGDAYGHYLTALTGYSQLLRHPKFTWTPRAEGVTVLGQTVLIDYFDERKFAAAAGNVARTAQQVIALTHRQSYRDDQAAGWSHFRDSKTNTRTGTTRHWGLDEWTSRATQGAYYHWLVGNAILPDKDVDPTHNGVQIIDRSTVPELKELPTFATDFQAKIDSANARLNPLGLSPNAIAFDISPAELKSGKSHYDQIYERSLRATLNAKGAFDQAARRTRLLRNQENQVGDYNSAIVDQESAFDGQLIELYGRPYPSEVGPGKTYAQGYTGPDTLKWFIVDRPTGLEGTTLRAISSTNEAVTLTVKTPVAFGAVDLSAVTSATGHPEQTFTTRTIRVEPNRYVQFSDVYADGAPMGLRPVTGMLQQALLDAEQASLALRAGGNDVAQKYAIFERRRQLALAMVKAHAAAVDAEQTTGDLIIRLRRTQAAMESLGSIAHTVGDAFYTIGEVLKEGFPLSVGLATDGTSAIRTGVWGFMAGNGVAAHAVGLFFDSIAKITEVEQEVEQRGLDRKIAEFGFNYEQAQAIVEYEELLRDLTGSFHEISQLAITFQRANEQVRNLMAQGEGIQADREVFRQRAAAIIQGYRTKDLTFRTFRNEALEQYRSLFDLAGRYTYLAAKSYDYETGLLGSSDGQAVINGIVAARALGDLTGGTPQATVSTLGDAGLAGTMARLQADWAVAKGRLGINNPDVNGTLFSLRRELFRLVDGTAGDTAWQQTLEQHIMSNLMADSDVAAACRNLKKPDGSAVPGIVIPFSTTIQHGMNFFGLPSVNGDHNFSPSNYATKIYSVGLVLPGYIGMDPYAQGTPNAGGPNTSSPNGLNATPYVYLIPTGTDYMLAPPLGDTNTVRAFTVHDQALPLPFNLGTTAFSTTQFFNANGTLSEAPWILRKHQAFRPVSDPAFFYSTVPAEFTSSRLVGRSVWNGGWKLVIPAYTLLNAETDGLNRFAASVRDIQLFLRTYSHSGN